MFLEKKTIGSWYAFKEKKEIKPNQINKLKFGLDI